MGSETSGNSEISCTASACAFEANCETRQFENNCEKASQEKADCRKSSYSEADYIFQEKSIYGESYRRELKRRTKEVIWIRSVRLDREGPGVPTQTSSSIDEHVVKRLIRVGLMLVGLLLALNAIGCPRYSLQALRTDIFLAMQTGSK